MTVMTTVSATIAPEIRSSVAPLAAVGTGGMLVLNGVAVETDNVEEVSVESPLERLDRALDCEAEMLDNPDDTLEAIDEAAADAAELIEEAAELAPEPREAVALDNAAEMDAVSIGATIVTEDPEMTVVRVVDPVTSPGTVAAAPALDCELCSDANAELRIVRALVVPVGASGFGITALVIVIVPDAADGPPATTPAVFVAVRDSRAELRTDKALVVPGLAGVDSIGVIVVTGIVVATGTTTLIPTVDNETPPLLAEMIEIALVSMDDRAEAALLIPEATTTPADSVTVTVETIEGWPVQTGRVTLVI
ncbi:hypothetical protein FKW77_007860 [Venturia effusa]|uniref:Uncharacterized protein n=1 Tax=Venturia effusa TaxID=50376 RepID=A0A517LE65_9PEZI|nr:hypothetical protein FKW77_007860 [Venturia effusa]